MRLRAILTCLFLAVVATIRAQSGISMEATPAFEGFAPSSGIVPLRLSLDNAGPSASGFVEVTGEGFRTRYPVELPMGGRKELFVYPSIGYGDIGLALVTNRGRKAVKYVNEANSYGNQLGYLLISDNAGDLSFLRSRQNGPGNAVAVVDAYVKPELVPDRPIAFSAMSAVLLGQGAERMTDNQVSAIKEWALSGGTLVFVGGASAPLLNDPRWASVLPVHGITPVTLPRSRVLQKLGGDVPIGPITLMSGETVSGAVATREGGTLISAKRSFGVGTVLFLAYNPFEPPMSQWSGRSMSVRAALRQGELEAKRRFVASFSQDPISESAPRARGGGIADDPFSATLPPAESIFKVLAIYFVIVVPVNFLVLKKLGRGEWAWFTAPIISLIFAGILFAQAQSLYSAKMSTASKGIVITQQGFPQGLFVGTSQLFVPRGGQYDLHLSGVDSVGGIDYNADYGYGYNSTPSVELDPVDDGEVHVPAMRANNLAFREIRYRQRNDAGNWFVVRRAGGKDSFVLINQSEFGLSNAQLVMGSRRIDLGDLRPGARKTFRLPKPGEGKEVAAGLGTVLTGDALAITGTLSGFRPGPQLGEEITNRTDIRYVMVLSEGRS